jgi:hypothetical protein
MAQARAELGFAGAPGDADAEAHRTAARRDNERCFAGRDEGPADATGACAAAVGCGSGPDANP